jgi:hypothetical protein
MKKIFLMFAFAGIATFASAQTEQVASKASTKAESKDCTKICTPEEKASCEKMVSNKGGCCSSKSSASSTAAKAEKVTTVNKKAVATTGNK